MGKGERLTRVKILLLAVLLAVVAITSALRLNETVYDASQRFYGYLREGQSAEAWGMLAAEVKQKIAPGDITSLEAALEAFERTDLPAPTGKNGFFKAVKQGSEAVIYWKRGFSGWRVAYMSPWKGWNLSEYMPPPLARTEKPSRFSVIRTTFSIIKTTSPTTIIHYISWIPATALSGIYPRGAIGCGGHPIAGTWQCGDGKGSS